MRYLLAKLCPEVCTDIITYYKVLKQRDDLVLLATYLEGAKHKSHASSRLLNPNHKHNISKLQLKSQGKKK